MTISHSRIATMLAVALVGATAARAQDTVQTGAQVERPSVHVVQLGETLWGLAQQYLGDPLLWPEIYRLNTVVVEDPHWIFPGEELAFGGPPPVSEQPAEPTTVPPVAGLPVPMEPAADTTPAISVEPNPMEPPAVETPPPPPPPPPADASSPTVFSRRMRATGLARIAATGGEAYRYRPVRRGEFYSAGFLTEGASLPWGRVLGEVRESRVNRDRATSSATIYQTVELRAPGGATYREGDSLLVANVAREIPGGWGNVVVPSGIVRVTHVNGEAVLGEVVAQFNRVVNGHMVMPLEQFPDPGMVTPVPVNNGMAATVVDLRDIHPVPNQQNIIFIDAGRTQGVALGDLFDILEEPNPQHADVQEPVALLQIVHLRDRSSSGLIVQIYQPGIQPGQPVRLIRKMPS